MTKIMTMPLEYADSFYSLFAEVKKIFRHRMHWHYMNILTPARVKIPIPGAWILQFQNGKGPSGLHNYEYSFLQKCRSRKDFWKTD